MESSTSPRKMTVTATVFVVIPCVLGLGIAQYLRWRGTVWLSSAGGFWPVVCLATSVAILISLALSSSKDRTALVCGWLVLTWTWFYVPLWLTAQGIAQSTAVVPRDGRVFVAGEAWPKAHRQGVAPHKSRGRQDRTQRRRHGRDQCRGAAISLFGVLHFRAGQRGGPLDARSERRCRNAGGRGGEIPLTADRTLRQARRA